MQNYLVNVNGEFLPTSQAVLSVLDRSFLYGDSLYEVVRTYGDTLFDCRGHMDRLKRSGQKARLDLSPYLNEYERAFRSSVEEYRKRFPNSTDLYLRLVVSRGMGKIGFSTKNVSSKPFYTVITKPLDPPSEQVRRDGVTLKVSSYLRNDPRALDPAMKSGNYLNSILAFFEAESEGFSDALLCNHQGFLTEGTTFNFFYVRGGVVATPPLDIGILEGITRSGVIECLKQENIPVREIRFPKERLYEADEVFVTSTIKEVLGVVKVDDHVIQNGKPGPLTQKLAKTYRDWALRQC